MMKRAITSILMRKAVILILLCGVVATSSGCFLVAKKGVDKVRGK